MGTKTREQMLKHWEILVWASLEWFIDPCFKTVILICCNIWKQIHWDLKTISVWRTTMCCRQLMLYHTVSQTVLSTFPPYFLSRKSWQARCDLFYFPKIWSNNRDERNSVYLHWRIPNESLQLYGTKCQFTSRLNINSEYKWCLFWVLYDEKRVVATQMYGNRFRTKNYNDSVTVGCQVIVRENLGVMNQLQHPIINETHKTRTNLDSMPSNRPKKSMYHQAKVITNWSKLNTIVNWNYMELELYCWRMFAV